MRQGKKGEAVAGNAGTHAGHTGWWCRGKVDPPVHQGHALIHVQRTVLIWEPATAGAGKEQG